MSYIEFTGELDAPKSGFVPFTGKLDEEPAQQQIADAPAPLGDPMGTGASEIANAPFNRPEAGAGRGFVNPPMAADTGKRDVGTAESFARGFGESGAKTAKYTAAAASALPVIAEAAINAVKAPFGGKADYSWQDAAFRQLVDPAQNAVDYYGLQPNERMDLTSKIAHGVGGLLQDLPAIIASGGLTEAPAAVAKTPGMMEFLGKALSTGFESMRPVILKAAGEKADQVLQSGGTPRQAAVSALTAGMWAGLQGAAPMSMQGPRAVRAVTGFPVGVATGEAGRVVQNAADPENLQQPFDLSNAVVEGVQGSLLAAGMPGHEPARVRPSAEARETVAPRAEPARVEDVLSATSVDEAIQAAERVANPTPEGAIRSQMLAIRPLEVPNVSRETAVPAVAAGADRGGSADAGAGVEPGIRGIDEPAGRLAEEPAAAGAEGEPVPPRGPADAVAQAEPPPQIETAPAAREVERAVAGIVAQRNPTGTLTVRGDPATVAATLRAHEIPFVPSADGALVGRTHADAAERALADFAPPKAPVEAPVDTPAAEPPGAVHIEPPAPAEPGKVQSPAPVFEAAPKVERFPRVESFEGVNVGPGGFIKPRPIAAGKHTFRETDVGGLDDRMREDRQAVPFNSFVADRPELALGQGTNRGVQITFRPDAVSGREHSKPMTGDLAGREYRTDLLAPRAVQSVTLFPADLKAARATTRMRLAEDFNRVTLPDGRLHFTRKGLPEIEPHELEPIEYQRNPSGTLTVKGGDELVLRKVLETSGVTKIIRNKDGFLIGKKDADTAEAVLSKLPKRDSTREDDADSPVEDGANPADAELRNIKLTGSDRATDANPDQGPLFKRSPRAATGIDEPTFHSAMADAFGKDVAKRLIDKGVVVPLADQSKLPAHVVPFVRDGDMIFGFYDPKTDRTYAVLSNLRPEMVRPLALHEVGVHYGFEAMLGRDKYNQVINRIAVMGKAGNKAVIEAKAQAKENSSHSGQVPEETLAYLVTNHPEMGVVREVIARIKAFLFREFGIGGKYLTDNDITMLARAAVLHSSRTEPGQRAPEFAAQFARGRDDIRFARAATTDPDLPDEVRAPYAGPGRRMVRAASDLYSTLRHDLMMGVAPMSATDNKRAQAMAQTYANQTRWAQIQWGRMQRLLEKQYTADERRRMWEAADAENVERIRERDEEGYTRAPDTGLASLTPKEREGVQTLHDYGQQLWSMARDAGMVEGDGLPFWTPRLLVTIGEDGDIGKLRSLGGAKMATDGTGRNITTNSSNLKHRKHLTTEETEAAASSIARGQGAEGAKVVRDIMTMPLAMYRLERAIAGRRLINQIKEVGQATGEDLVRDGAAEGYITIPHPAFTTYRPRFTKDAEGKTVPVTDADGNVVMDRVPLYIRKDFEGPLRAVMSSKDSSWYTGYMLLKSKAMSAIMFSPLIHNMVIWGKAIPASPVKMLTFQLYAKGHALLRDNALLKEAVENGLVPIGENHSQSIDVTDIAQNFKPLGDRWGDPNESWLTLSVEKLGNLLHDGAGSATKRGMDAAGEFLHHTLLWKQIGALQMGIYADAKQRYMTKGFSEEAAGIQAAHLANRYGGVVAKENQSAWARKLANVLLFSRSFNFTNLGTIKDTWGAMPTGLKALLSERAPADANRAEWQQRRKAWSVIALDVGLAVIATSLMQDFVDAIKKDKSADEIARGYIDRAKDMVANIAQNPLKPGSYNPMRLSSTWANEPGKKDRVDMGASVGERHEYMRLPTGKVAEDLIGWTTETLETFERKMAPIPKAVMEASLGKTTIGMPVADPNGSIIKRIGEGVAHVMKAQLPWDDLTRVYDWMQGHATELDKKKVMGTVTGFTFSQGHPGGPEAAVNQKTQDRFEMARRYVMQLVKDDLKRGDEDRARERMEAIGMTPREINRAIQQALEPRSGLSKQARQKFERRANDTEREEMERQRSR